MSNLGNSHPHSKPGGSRGRRFLPPEPIGTPYQGDPAAPFPFETDAAAASPVYPYGPPSSLQAPGQASVGPPPGFASAPPQQQSMPLPPEFTQQRVRAANVDPGFRDARRAMWVGVTSLFVLGLVLGPIGVVLGVRAVRAGQRRLGWIAIVTGAVGFVVHITVLVLAAAGVIPSPAAWLESTKESA